VVQTGLEADAVAAWGIPRVRILKLGMGVDREAVTGGDPDALRERLGIPAARKVVGQVGVNDPNKGTCDLVRAVARLNQSRRGDDVIHLVLGGNSSPAFEAFAAGLPDPAWRWLSVLGPVAPEDRPEFYAALDLFAMPSRTDSFGIVVLEAWANALPVVAAAAGGVAEVVAHDRTGLLVPFGDVEALASALSRPLADPSLARRLGEAGRDLEGQHGYSWDARFDTLLARTRSLFDVQTQRAAG
jgi:glycosyltransferase involved in cell wall biosynthesis